CVVHTMSTHATKSADLHRCFADLRINTKPTPAQGLISSIAARLSDLENSALEVPMKWSTTCVMCLLFCRCWQCGALQQPGGYPQVDHHQPEQPQFDYEAELALVAQFQEQFHELDQALTALQPHPDPPAQPARTPLRLFNRFALLDLESGVQKEQE
ncbi:hypothetical protein QJQ45_017563, partial [Haematococcus lacustris]